MAEVPAENVKEEVTPPTLEEQITSLEKVKAEIDDIINTLTKDEKHQFVISLSRNTGRHEDQHSNAKRIGHVHCAGPLFSHHIIEDFKALAESNKTIAMMAIVEMVGETGVNQA